MEFFISFVSCFLVVFIIYYLFVVINKKYAKKMRSSVESKLLTNLSHVDLSHVSDKRLVVSIAFANAFIISIVFSIVFCFIRNSILKMIIGFLILIPMILIVYFIFGKILKMKEGK